MTRRTPHSSFRLGFLNRVYAPQFEPRLYQQTLELFEAAEELGFDSGWLAQHHFASENGRLPSPLVLLSAAAERTRHIQLGTGIIVLNQENALRLAEDAAVLDLLSQGRLQLGLGAGFDPDSFTAFGQSLEGRHTQYDQRLERLRQALAGEPLNAEGRVLRPAASGLEQRLWEATSRVEQVAARGNGLILAPNPTAGAEPRLQVIERYRRAWNPTHSGSPRVALVRAVFPGRDAAAEGTTLRQDILTYVERQRRIGIAHADPAQGFEAVLDALGVLHGDPAKIAQQLRAEAPLGADDQLIVQVQTTSTGFAEALRHLETVARDIAPALGWQPRQQRVSAQEIPA
ncbi:LLM class flavin-dependent oxidoreductase [Pseudomonas multiresinivorans]|uniref:LLM class flavin-dependent oxidoreductase n=1 Tax=Pseudomonas multiresinivorans TaxID=95301 RepID=A0A7Z3BL38_9PSED|nr:LLM class flavin-dependent oxidoreductase [Pseudomonas multiresinivorans]QJP08792.1 LLM class flavin-dependent oxidoreductase [Pseudomonas multiresinivorans]